MHTTQAVTINYKSTLAGLNVAHVECFIREIILLLEKRCWINREAEF